MSINNLLDSVSHRYPNIVATGFTTAYLGDERSLREFIVGDHICSQIALSKGNAVFYLINDSYDSLRYRQLRIALNKDERLLAQFEHYCGRPIAEIPDPFGCHESYSQHFSKALLERLHHLDIYPVMLDTYQAYRSGYYDKFIGITIEKYFEIQKAISDKFNLIIHDLLHLKCPQCQHMDATHIQKVVNGSIQLECGRCNTERWYDTKELEGKLSWKLDCAARWNLYQIGIEAFSKIHLSPRGTFEVSQFVSENFYGGCVPVPIKYGVVQLDKEISYKLLQILPPTVLKNFFLTHFNRDIYITKDSLEHFCHRFHIRPGVSYIDYIHKELPLKAIRSTAIEISNAVMPALSEEDLLATYGKHFAKFYYNKDYSISFPDFQIISSTDVSIVGAAQDIILYAISVHKEQQSEEANKISKISAYLKDQRRAPVAAIQYIRKLLGQQQGLRLSMLLALLPSSYLQMIQTMLSCYISMQLPMREHGSHDDSTGTSFTLLGPTLSNFNTRVNWLSDSIVSE